MYENCLQSFASPGNYLSLLTALITNCVNIPANKQLFNIDQNDGGHSSFLLCDRLWVINLVTSQKSNRTWWINFLPTLQFSRTSYIYSFSGESIVGICLKGMASSFMGRKKKRSKIKLIKDFFWCRKMHSLIRLVHTSYFPLRNAAFIHVWLTQQGVDN